MVGGLQPPQFLADGFEEFGPGLFELLDAFGFQDREHIGEIDADGLQGGEDRRCM